MHGPQMMCCKGYNFSFGGKIFASETGTFKSIEGLNKNILNCLVRECTMYNIWTSITKADTFIYSFTSHTPVAEFSIRMHQKDDKFQSYEKEMN